MENESGGEVSAEGPGFKFRARGYDAIVMIVVLALGGFFGMLWMHMEDTKRAFAESVAVNREGAMAMKESVKVQRLQACIIATPEAQREAQYGQPHSFCNRVSQ